MAVIAGFAGEETNDGHAYHLAQQRWEPEALSGLAALRPCSVCGVATLADCAVLFGGEVDPGAIYFARGERSIAFSLGAILFRWRSQFLLALQYNLSITAHAQASSPQLPSANRQSVQSVPSRAVAICSLSFEALVRSFIPGSHRLRAYDLFRLRTPIPSDSVFAGSLRALFTALHDDCKCLLRVVIARSGSSEYDRVNMIE